MTGFLKGKIIKIEILSFLPSSLPFTQLGSQRRDEWEEGTVGTGGANRRLTTVTPAKKLPSPRNRRNKEIIILSSFQSRHETSEEGWDRQTGSKSKNEARKLSVQA